MGKKNKKGYRKIGRVLGIDTTMLQAAALLDEAAVRAIESRDPTMSLTVARQWMELGAMMHAVMSDEKPDSDNDEGDEDLGSSIMGFGNKEAREKAEAVARERKSKG